MHGLATRKEKNGSSGFDDGANEACNFINSTQQMFDPIGQTGYKSFTAYLSRR
jgi:hypothetical protein